MSVLQFYEKQLKKCTLKINLPEVNYSLEELPVPVSKSVRSNVS